MLENLVIPSHHRRHTLAPYHIKATSARGNRIVSGRDSLMFYEGRVAEFDGPASSTPPDEIHLKVGSFCQQAAGLQIFLGGEHHHHRIINNSLSHFDELRRAVSDDLIDRINSFSKGPTEIGNNVIISRNVCILSGVKIGDGAVLGANSLITRDVPPYAIVGGNPARVINRRFPDPVIEGLLKIRWWDFDYRFLREHLNPILAAEPEEFVERFSDRENNVYEKPGRYILIRYGPDETGELTVVIDGIEENGRKYTGKALPAEIVGYLSQNDPRNVTIDHDIFRHLNPGSGLG